MRFKDVKVGGISTVLFEKCDKKNIAWKKVEWKKLETGNWQRQTQLDDLNGRGIYTHAEMCSLINQVKNDRRYEVGIDASCGTLHVIRKYKGVPTLIIEGTMLANGEFVGELRKRVIFR